MERCKEHHRWIRLHYLQKSDLAEHSLQKGHEVLFASTTVLPRSVSYVKHSVQEALEIQTEPKFICS